MNAVYWVIAGILMVPFVLLFVCAAWANARSEVSVIEKVGMIAVELAECVIACGLLAAVAWRVPDICRGAGFGLALEFPAVLLGFVLAGFLAWRMIDNTEKLFHGRTKRVWAAHHVRNLGRVSS